MLNLLLRKQRSYRKNLLHLLFGKCFNFYDKTSNDYKFIIITNLLNDTLLSVIYTVHNSDYIKFISDNLNVSHHRHNCNCWQRKNIFQAEYVVPAPYQIAYG
jgi:hypothetical protein